MEGMSKWLSIVLVWCAWVALGQGVEIVPDEVYTRMNPADGRGALRVVLERGSAPDEQESVICVGARVRVSGADGTPVPNVHAYTEDGRPFDNASMYGYHCQHHGRMGLELPTPIPGGVVQVQGELDYAVLEDEVQSIQINVVRGQSQRVELAEGLHVDVELESAEEEKIIYGDGTELTRLRIRYDMPWGLRLRSFRALDAEGNEVESVSGESDIGARSKYLKGNVEQCRVLLEYAMVERRFSCPVNYRFSLCGIEPAPTEAVPVQTLPVHSDPRYFSRRIGTLQGSGFGRRAYDRRPHSLPEGALAACVQYLAVELRSANHQHPQLILRMHAAGKLFGSRVESVEWEQIRVTDSAGNLVPVHSRLTEFERIGMEVGIGDCRDDRASVRVGCDSFAPTERLLVSGVVVVELHVEPAEGTPYDVSVSVPFSFFLSLSEIIPGPEIGIDGVQGTIDEV